MSGPVTQICPSCKRQEPAAEGHGQAAIALARQMLAYTCDRLGSPADPCPMAKAVAEALTRSQGVF